jgi:hypothetical protein
MGKLAPLSRRVLPYRTGGLLTIHLAAGEGHQVTYSHRSRPFDYGVHARTGEQTGSANLDSVVLRERPEDLGVLGELLLGERRHHASRIGQGHAESYRVPDRDATRSRTGMGNQGNFVRSQRVHDELNRTVNGGRMVISETRKRGASPSCAKRQVGARRYRTADPTESYAQDDIPLLRA